MTTNPYSSPQSPGNSPGPKVVQKRTRIIELLVAIGIIGILVALLLPARRNARGAARSQCRNNLRQIVIALQHYESVYHSLPPAYTVDAEGKPLHSWRTLILPHIGLEKLYETIDLSKPWDDPVNKTPYETPVSDYRCPSVDGPATHTAYLAVIASDSCLQTRQSRELSDVTDDHDLTLVVIETNTEQTCHWMSPTDLSMQKILNLGSAPGLPHTGSAQAVSLSGLVMSVNADSKPSRLRALISINGNDDAIAMSSK